MTIKAQQVEGFISENLGKIIKMKITILGIGSRGDVQPLAAAIHTAMTDEQMHKNAARLSEVIRHEDGVGNAVQIIEQEVAKQGRRDL